MNERKKLLIILTAAFFSFLLLILIISIIYIIFFQTNNKNTSSLEKYTDPGSGEIIYSGKNKAVEKSTIEDNKEIVFLGFSKISDIGTSKTQLERLKSFFIYYKNHKDKSVNEISVTSSTVKHTIARDSKGDIDSDTATFTITINRKNKFHTEVKYIGLNNIYVKLFNIDKTKLIFSSDDILRD